MVGRGIVYQQSHHISLKSVVVIWLLDHTQKSVLAKSMLVVATVKHYAIIDDQSNRSMARTCLASKALAYRIC